MNDIVNSIDLNKIMYKEMRGLVDPDHVGRQKEQLLLKVERSGRTYPKFILSKYKSYKIIL